MRFKKATYCSQLHPHFLKVFVIIIMWIFCNHHITSHFRSFQNPQNSRICLKKSVMMMKSFTTVELLRYRQHSHIYSLPTPTLLCQEVSRRPYMPQVYPGNKTKPKQTMHNLNSLCQNRWWTSNILSVRYCGKISVGTLKYGNSWEGWRYWRAYSGSSTNQVQIHRWFRDKFQHNRQDSICLDMLYSQIIDTLFKPSKLKEQTHFSLSSE